MGQRHLYPPGALVHWWEQGRSREHSSWSTTCRQDNQEKRIAHSAIVARKEGQREDLMRYKNIDMLTTHNATRRILAPNFLSTQSCTAYAIYTLESPNALVKCELVLGTSQSQLTTARKSVIFLLISLFHSLPLQYLPVMSSIKPTGHSSAGQPGSI